MNTTTRRYPRTLLEAFPCDASNANPIQRYRQPLPKRLFFFLARNGWAVLLLCAFVFSGSGCSNDPELLAPVAASVKDAPQQVRADQRYEAAVVAMRGE